jgi:hypothetical protein
MTEASVSFAGNLTDDPQVRSTEGGIARATFRVAVRGRREQEASFITVIVWRDQAEHASQSLSKGSRVVVVGRLNTGVGPPSMATPNSGRHREGWVYAAGRSWTRGLESPGQASAGENLRRGRQRCGATRGRVY